MNNTDRNGLQDEPKKLKKWQIPPSTPSSNSKSKNTLPNVLLCFKKPEKPSEKPKEVKHEESPTKSKKSGVKRSKSRELRAGILYVGCDCERRNGLQDHCPRSDCQGAPECMTFPPTCPPSEFAQNKHMVKKYEQLAKDREAFAKQMRDKRSGGGASGEKGSDKHSSSGGGKIDYDCFPLDDLMKAGAPCPLCDKPIDGCDTHHHKSRDIVVGPIIIDLDPDCMCPEAS